MEHELFVKYSNVSSAADGNSPVLRTDHWSTVLESLSLPTVSLLPTGALESSSFVALILLVAALALLPLLVLVCTCFLRVSIVLGILRAGLGAQGVIPAFATSAFALMVTAQVMFPVAVECLNRFRSAPLSELVVSGQEPSHDRQLPSPIPSPIPSRGEGRFVELIRHIGEPLLMFLVRNSDEREYQFAEQRLSNWAEPQSEVASATEDAETNERDEPFGQRRWRVAIPAFVLTELRRGFESGLLLILPMLVVDLVILLLFTAFGISSVAPQTVALPTKLAVFTLGNGWIRLFDSLQRSYQL